MSDAGGSLLEEAHTAEQRFSAILRTHDPGDEALARACDELRRAFRRLIVEQPELAQRKGAEQSLWFAVFHRRIELLRRQLDAAAAHGVQPPHAAEGRRGERRRTRAEPNPAGRAMAKAAAESLAQVLDEGEQFYTSLLQDLQTHHHVSCLP